MRIFPQTTMTTIEIFNGIAAQLAEARRLHERGEIESAWRLYDEASHDFEQAKEELEKMPGFGVLKGGVEKTGALFTEEAFR